MVEKIKDPLHNNSLYNYFLRIVYVGIKGPNRGIGPWAMPEDVVKPEEKHVVGRTSRLLG